MKHKLACLLCGVSVLACASARAGDSLTEALATIPGDAMAFVCVPSIQTLDADYQEAVVSLGLQPFVQPPFDSLVGALKTFMPMLGGLDESGPLTIVLMPAATLRELQMTQAIVVPTKDPKAMVEAMMGQPGEDGLWMVNMMGQPAQAAVGQGRLILAQQASIVKAVKDSESNIAAKLKPSEKKALEGLDLVVWMDADRFFALLKPMIDPFLTSMVMMQQAAGGFEAKSAEMNKKGIDMFLEGTSSFSLGLALDKGGVGLRFALGAKPGSGMVDKITMKPTSASLLAGLPASEYLLAFGETIHPAQVNASLEDLDVWLTPPADAEEADAEKMKQLQGIIKEAVTLWTGLRGSVEALPPGPDGLFGVWLIFDTADSTKSLELKSKMIEIGKGLLADLAKKEEEGVLGQVSEAIQYQKEAEEIAGVKVTHLGFDLAKIQDIEEEDRDDILKVIGKEGVLLRMAPVSPKRVVVSFGGGKAEMATLIEQAKKDGAPLEEDAGIMKVAGVLPKPVASVGYVAADRILASINQVMTVLEEEKLPVQMPPLDAPMAMATTGGDGWAQFDLFFPTELVVASKNAFMVMMGQRMGEPAAPDSTTETPPETP